MPPTLETKRVLVTVKAYPNPSKKYGETVCVAGVDVDAGKWVRLYPIPFRDLDDEKRFKKYSTIEIKTFKAQDDHRPESFKVDADSIKILSWTSTENKWEGRKKALTPTLSPSFCKIQEDRKLHNISLGMFKPERVDFTIAPCKTEDQEKRERSYKQLDIYRPQKTPIEQVPFDFRYSFYCSGIFDCPGHDLMIVDWELNQSFRRWRYKYKPEQVLLEKIKQRWLGEMCSDRKDTYFFIGNVKRFPDTFMVLGVFYPPKY